MTSTPSNDINFYATQLVITAQEAAPHWIVEQITQHLTSPLSAQEKQEILKLAEESSNRVIAELEQLVLTDIDQQKTTPLSVLRQLVPTITKTLDSHNVKPVRRDSQKAQIYPNDIYDVTPANFASFGADMHEVGIAWGAAKAYEHLQRHKQKDQIQ